MIYNAVFIRKKFIIYFPSPLLAKYQIMSCILACITCIFFFLLNFFSGLSMGSRPIKKWVQVKKKYKHSSTSPHPPLPFSRPGKSPKISATRYFWNEEFLQEKVCKLKIASNSNNCGFCFIKQNISFLRKWTDIVKNAANFCLA